MEFLAGQTIEAALLALVFDWWRLSARDGKVLLSAIMRSKFERPTTLRRHLALAGMSIPTAQGSRGIDLDHIFLHIATPTFIVAMMEDLVLEGKVKPPMASKIESHILGEIARDGAWR
jgi:hypothetical protein